MKIEYTRGCICDAILIDGENEYDITNDKRTLGIEKVKNCVNKKGGIKDHFETFINEYDCMTHDECDGLKLTFCEEIGGTSHVNDIPVEEFSEEQAMEIFNLAISTLPPESFNYLIQWFMEDYIGLDYQYHCEECGDLVYSKTIKV